MNKYEIRMTLLAGALLMVFLFSLLYNAFSRKIDVQQCLPYDAAFQKSLVKKITDSTYEVYIVTQMWSFGPDVITLPAGSEVNLYVTSKDVVHGFDIDKKGVNLMAIPGALSSATVKFSEPGIYRVVCHEYCGIGHQNMQGQFIITNK
ncbi:MAG: cytochrome c oxidase subunit II [Chitinophagaceae bacterium]|jgi:cytochrome c oxidase subunit 2|nr:cytochrome c oxidase subunit II [Chitinophagaceae bacterium]